MQISVKWLFSESDNNSDIIIQNVNIMFSLKLKNDLLSVQ